MVENAEIGFWQIFAVSLLGIIKCPLLVTIIFKFLKSYDQNSSFWSSCVLAVIINSALSGMQ